VQAADNKQGSDGFVEIAEGKLLTEKERELQRMAREIYEERLEKGVAREQARKDLPLSTYTEAYWKVDLHNLFHFLSLRMDDHSQSEIRTYARVMGEEIVSKWCPLAWEAFTDYRMSSMFLTGLEIPIVGAIVAGEADKAVSIAEGYGWLKQGKKGLMKNRERNELEGKLRRVNMGIPWRKG
jgi:thymidylate synthase (FAD)